MCKSKMSSTCARVHSVCFAEALGAGLLKSGVGVAEMWRDARKYGKDLRKSEGGDIGLGFDKIRKGFEKIWTGFEKIGWRFEKMGGVLRKSGGVLRKSAGF